MKWSFLQMVDLLSKNNNYRVFRESKHGLERECLRVSENGKISQIPHLKEFGSALTNPYITTDFSEAQLELVTPTFHRENMAVKFLQEIHLYIEKHLGKELLWPFSMPGKLPNEEKIPLAEYGSSDTAQKKTLYRLGLSHRYGRKMQTVSGTHYNFSFSEKFWDLLQKKFAPKIDIQNFKSEKYLALIRNFLRYSWINTYLFGAAPVVDRTYPRQKNKGLKRFRLSTFYGPYATSLRMSELGYYSKVQSQLAVSFNSLDEYIRDLSHAILTPSPKYKNFPGLNDHILQIENEHYSRIRPKQVLRSKETPLQAIKERGILYVEARAVDIDPFSPLGVSEDQLSFLHVFLIYCLFKESPFLNCDEQKELTTNQNTVALFGRKPGLELNFQGKKIEIISWAEKIISEMSTVANLLDKALKTNLYSRNLASQILKIKNPELTPSADLLQKLFKSKMSFQKYGLKLAENHKKSLKQKSGDKKTQELLTLAAKKSLIDQKNVEIKEEALLDGYEDMEISTQILMRAAKKRNIKVEILDRKENFIRLSKGKKVHYIKQATLTNLDSMITYFIMGNKEVSKVVLAENGLNVPKGKLFENIEQALNGYAEFAKSKIVIKPTTTNHGIGISFCEPNEKEKYSKAIETAFGHCKSVVVEEFFAGNEYRFMVINFKNISVINRIPANIIGDGKNTIRQLVKIKNEDPKYYKFFETYTIKTGKVEEANLKAQGLRFSSIPKKGQQIFLRTNSNVGTGGDPIDCTDDIAEKFKRIAEQAARAVNAKICGLDMIINGDKYTIIEVNYNPALQMQEFPVEGKPRSAAGPILDLLGF